MNLHLALDKTWPACGGILGLGDLGTGGHHKGSMLEARKWPSRKREGIKFKLFKLVRPEMRTDSASSQPCYSPFSGHNLTGPR